MFVFVHSGKQWTWEGNRLCCEASDSWFSLQQRMCSAWIFNSLNTRKRHH